MRLFRKIAAHAPGVLLLALTSAARADIYSYECDSLAAPAGWELFQAFCDPQEWVDDGTLVQQVLLCDDFPGEGQQIDYFRDVVDLEGLTTWFIEWRMMTTGISEEIPFVAPAALVAHNGTGMTYHFTIANDRVRFIRDLALPILNFDLESGVMHSFRVEIFGVDLGETYVVYIDGDIVDNGEAEGPYFNPPWVAQVEFRAKSRIVPSLTAWDYIRWGEIPLPGTGDLTLDGEVDFDDLPFFQECLTTEAGGWAGCAWADMDFDSDTDCDDWALFVAAWTDPADPPCMIGCDCAPADFNGDGSVNASDLALLLGSWGPCPDPENCPVDLNGDGSVGAADLAMLLGSWG